MSNNLCSTTHENPITLKTVFDVISFFSSSELIQRLLITLVFEHRERDIRNLKRKKNCLRDFLNIYIYTYNKYLCKILFLRFFKEFFLKYRSRMIMGGALFRPERTMTV